MTFIKTIEARRHVDEQELWDIREVILGKLFVILHEFCCGFSQGWKSFQNKE